MTATFACLDFRFSVHASAPALQDLVEELYAPFASDVVPTTRFRLEERRRDGVASFDVYSDTELVRASLDPDIALAHLVWEIGQGVVASSSATTMLLVHAAAAERDGHAVLLSAPSGWGKSTLVTGLLGRGFRYLTDDIAPVATTGPAPGMVHPYPKPISISRKYWPLFPRLQPLPYAWHHYLGVEGFISARAVGATIGEPSVPRLVVSPHYRAGATTRMTSLSRAEALVMLAEQSFNVGAFGSHAVDLLSSMLQRCRCFRLEFSDLDQAVRLVEDSFDEVTHGTDERSTEHIS